VTLREPRRTVHDGKREIVLHELSPTERQRRRWRRNLVLWLAGSAVLATAAWMLGRL
jgi:hypothetical protein